ncbi:ParB N-terminal domain-containing protein [Nocardia higoensis]|uniref:ParB N-terminal domain-containing protein n=1 Tax=Nocardia higoensis TaxID=228599 RepID=A0ABS0DIC8_9NOCA|nr:ParB N-terminal domain-containing protein [Nocardia higoensis]MBF6358174.1 ParB N-terminal domain-containing protein [Nocardia higoensis]
MRERWSLLKVLGEVATGDGWAWESEASWLWEQQPEYMAALEREISRDGIQEPIEIAATADGRYRMWNGHHRVVIARWLGLSDIPVEVFGEAA